WMVDGRPIFPGALWLQVGVASGHPLNRQVANTDEVVEVELRDCPADRELGVPAAAGLPVDRQVRLEELECSVGDRVTADGQIRKLVIHAAVDTKAWRQGSAEVDVNLAALLLHQRVGDRKGDPLLLPGAVDGEQVDVV